MTISNIQSFKQLSEINKLQEKDVKYRIKQKYYVKPKTEGQRDFIETIDDCVITICSGCAGTGKTHIAMAKSIEYLRENKVSRVILIRPLQECGKGLGFMPGDKTDKMNPHMLAFHELFHKILSKDELAEYTKEGKLVIDTLEYLRGVTFENCFVVVDEAQNCTYDQLRMVLTRIGPNSKIVIVGDSTQTDLNFRDLLKSSSAPLELVMDCLEDIDDDIGVIELTEEDIVRHGLIAKICKHLPRI